MKSKVLLLLFLVNSILPMPAQVADQMQLNYNSDISGRRLTGYSAFQSFTAGITGTMVQLDLGFVGGIVGTTNGIGSLRIYAGNDTTGGLLQATTVTVVCANGPCMMNFMVSVPVISGQPYNFRFTPGAGMPDPYYLQGESPGTYSGGNMGSINPFIMNHNSLYDLVFRTYVVTNGTNILQRNEAPVLFSVFPNPVKESMTISWDTKYVSTEVKEVLVTDISGKTIKQLSIAPGQKSIVLTDLQNGLYFITLKNAWQQPIAAQKIIVYN